MVSGISVGDWVEVLPCVLETGEDVSSVAATNWGFNLGDRFQVVEMGDGNRSVRGSAHVAFIGINWVKKIDPPVHGNPPVKVAIANHMVADLIEKVDRANMERLAERGML